MQHNQQDPAAVKQGLTTGPVGAPVQPCGHPVSRIKRARAWGQWSYWCGECAKQALEASNGTEAA